MALTETKVKNARPGPKTTRLFDEKGLYLEISPSGNKWWRFKYRINSNHWYLLSRLYLRTSRKVYTKQPIFHTAAICHASICHFSYKRPF